MMKYVIAFFVILVVVGMVVAIMNDPEGTSRSLNRGGWDLDD